MYSFEEGVINEEVGRVMFAQFKNFEILSALQLLRLDMIVPARARANAGVMKCTFD